MENCIFTIITVVGVIGTWFSAVFTYFTYKKAKEIESHLETVEYEELLKMNKYFAAFNMLLDNSMANDNYYKEATKCHFMFFGMYVGKLKNYSQEEYDFLKTKLSKTKLSNEQKEELTNLFSRVFLSNGTVEIRLLE